MYYHASPVGGIRRLEPRVSNHGVPRIYFSDKRENVLVYLCNAVEKYCKETGFAHHGPWQKWGPYGFTPDGILRLEEYYPNATEETYRGVSGYLYSVDDLPDARPLEGIPFAFTADHPVEVSACQFIPDAYQAILAAVAEGKLALLRYEDMPPKGLAWIDSTIRREFAENPDKADYRHFLLGKFPFLREADSI